MPLVTSGNLHVLAPEVPVALSHMFGTFGHARTVAHADTGYPDIVGKAANRLVHVVVDVLVDPLQLTAIGDHV